MGYYIEITESDWFLPEIHYEAALKVLKNLNSQDSLKSGGSSTGEKWFSWMPKDYDQTVTSVAEVLDLLGFETETQEGVGLSITCYDNKTGDEDVFLNAICPFTTGSIAWRGEDGERWKTDYVGVTPRHYSGTTTWVREGRV